MPVQADYPIVDADGHVVEVDAEIRAYLPERYRRIPDNREYSLFPIDAWSFGVSDRHKQDVPTAEMWLSFLDDAGIAASVLYPSNALTHGLIRHVQWSVDLARAYNDWLYHQFTSRTDRLYGVALLSIQDVDAARDELRRCVNDYGFVGGLLLSVAAPLRSLGHRDFDPLYATVQELDSMLAVHGGAVGPLNFSDPMQHYREVRSVKHTIGQMLQLTMMISQGVYDRFPGLRVAYLEAGCGWVLHLMDALDDQFAKKGAQDLQKRPSEYIQGDNIYFSFEIEERLLPTVIETLGAHKLIWPSDYPHERPREAFFDDLPGFFGRADVSEESRRLILSENPQRLYRLRVPSLAAG